MENELYDSDALEGRRDRERERENVRPVGRDTEDLDHDRHSQSGFPANEALLMNSTIRSTSLGSGCPFTSPLNCLPLRHHTIWTFTSIPDLHSTYLK